MRRPPTLRKPVTAAAPEPDSTGRPPSYLQLYGLTKPPFGGAGYILFASHKRPYDALIDHVVNGSGVVLLQGEEGIGKTETLRSASAVAAEAGVPTILVSRPANGRINLTQLVTAIGDNDNSAEEAVEHFLAPPRKALLVDDFDLMPDDCVRLLSALMRRLPADAGGSAVVLSSSSGLPSAVGRPAASKAETLSITTIRIPRLVLSEVEQYIDRALSVAGGTTSRLISPDAMKLLTTRSGGVPAVINRLMQAALRAGFDRGDAIITAKTLDAAMDEPSPRPAQRLSKPSNVSEYALKIVATGLLVLGASTFIYKGLTGQPRPLAAPALSDIAVARLTYQHAADAGSATAATALAKTYDPNYAPPGSTPDTAQATDWYQKAIALGDPQAANLLKRIGPN